MATYAPTLRLASLLSPPTSFSRTSLQLQHAARKRWTAQSRVARLQSAAQRRWAATSPTAATSVTPTTTTVDEPAQAYKAPTTGLLGALPKSWVPYAELIRLDKPIGTYYLFLPCLFSTLLAAPLTNPMVPPTTVLGTSLLFFSGALIMRGAGCAINDLWDRNLDPHVSRTRLRPIARKAVTVPQAIVYLGFQLFAGLAVLLQFPWQCFFYATPSLLFVTAYPLAKRVTNYPQFVLGLTFSWGAFLGFPALGIDLMSNTSALISAACLYSSCVAWTMVYDMIYAYQDIKDDVKAGIKSIALAQERNGKIFLAAVSAVQVGLLAGAGAAIGAGPLFYFATCGGGAATLGYMIRKVDLKNVKDCWAWFKKGAWFTGGAIGLGLAAEYAAHYVGWYGIDRKFEETNVPKTSWKQIIEWSQGS
ncbi:4-hydroxybenzoate polyprenyl transferase [Teratosphaeria nubilosa]|uniref:4-hydroxybenzoate polyprenyltransferase, mitochondrial n=1 Tax=Teratosphaeria nubilosa TaxID=161662 RepID=A0A6G1LB41_9PEZI|nr:4-hydroxybenzoate polyprenyl transferase [Teratosphaeria nubilosa]